MVESRKVLNYEPDNYVIGDSLKPGTVFQGIVRSVEAGELKDFLTENQLNSWSKAKPDDHYLQVTVFFEGRTISKLISLPEDKEAHPSSLLGKWIKRYGKAPFNEQSVTVIINGDGFGEVSI